MRSIAKITRISESKLPFNAACFDPLSNTFIYYVQAWLRGALWTFRLEQRNVHFSSLLSLHWYPTGPRLVPPGDNSWITSTITSFTQLRKASKRSWALLLFIVSPVEIGAIHHHKADFSFLGVIWLLFWFTWLQVTSIDIRDFLKLPNSWQWLDCLFVFRSTLRNYENNNEWNVMDFWDSVIREPHIYGCNFKLVSISEISSVLLPCSKSYYQLWFIVGRILPYIWTIWVAVFFLNP